MLGDESDFVSLDYCPQVQICLELWESGEGTDQPEDQRRIVYKSFLLFTTKRLKVEKGDCFNFPFFSNTKYIWTLCQFVS